MKVGPSPAFQDTAYLSLGGEAIKKGRLVEARAYFQKEIDVNPTSHRGYSQMARIASLEGDHKGARDLLGQAIKMLGGVQGNAVPLLYRDMALESLALARETEAGANTQCGIALDDLAKARARILGIDPYASYRIEITTAEVYDEMSNIASQRGDQHAATAHRISSERHRNAARAIDPNDPRADVRMITK